MRSTAATCTRMGPAETCRSRASGKPHPVSFRFWSCAGPPPARGTVGLLLSLHWVFHGIELLEFRVVELPVHPLDLADVDRLHDVARLGVDGDLPARAFPGHALHGGQQRIAIGLAAGLLERL